MSSRNIKQLLHDLAEKFEELHGREPTEAELTDLYAHYLSDTYDQMKARKEES